MAEYLRICLYACFVHLLFVRLCTRLCTRSCTKGAAIKSAALALPGSTGKIKPKEPSRVYRLQAAIDF